MLEAAGRFHWRFEYTLLLGVAFMLTLYAIGFFYFSTDISNLRSYGYFGVFVINVVGAASILLPSPAAASVLGGGALLDDALDHRPGEGDAEGAADEVAAPMEEVAE